MQLLIRFAFYSMAGAEPDLPAARDLLDAGVHSFGSEDEKEKGLPKDPATHIDLVMRKLEHDEGGSSLQFPMLLVTIGTWLLALPKKLIARVLANEYIDFVELPPAKGKGRPMP